MGNWTPAEIANVIVQLTALIVAVTFMIKVLKGMDEQKQQLKVIHALGNSNLGIVLEDKAVLAESAAKKENTELTITAAKKARADYDEHVRKQKEADKV